MRNNIGVLSCFGCPLIFHIYFNSYSAQSQSLRYYDHEHSDDDDDEHPLFVCPLIILWPGSGSVRAQVKIILCVSICVVLLYFVEILYFI